MDFGRVNEHFVIGKDFRHVKYAYKKKGEQTK